MSVPRAIEFGSTTAFITTSCEPSNTTEPLRSPVKPIEREEKRIFADDALPVSAAVTFPAMKLPLASRITIALGVFVAVALEPTVTAALSPVPVTVIPVPAEAVTL